MIVEFLKKEDEIQVKELISRAFGYPVNDCEMNGSNYKFIVIKEENIVLATAMLETMFDPIKNFKILYIDYFCVDENHRGKGLGKKLFDEIEKVARTDNYDCLKLTSNPRRVAARSIYTSKGMVMIDTNLFIKELK